MMSWKTSSVSALKIFWTPDSWHVSIHELLLIQHGNGKAPWKRHLPANSWMRFPISIFYMFHIFFVFVTGFHFWALKSLASTGAETQRVSSRLANDKARSENPRWRLAWQLGRAISLGPSPVCKPGWNWSLFHTGDLFLVKGDLLPLNDKRYTWYLWWYSSILKLHMWGKETNRNHKWGFQGSPPSPLKYWQRFDGKCFVKHTSVLAYFTMCVPLIFQLLSGLSKKQRTYVDQTTFFPQGCTPDPKGKICRGVDQTATVGVGSSETISPRL